MAIKVAINGYGRIGRNILRALYERRKRKNDIQIVAVNDLGDANTNAHLTRYDTAHGPFPGKVAVDGETWSSTATGSACAPSAIRPSCRGRTWAWTSCSNARAFSPPRKRLGAPDGGAKKVIISAPGGKDVDATIVYGVNHATLKGSHTVISNASCTTNCLAPLVKALMTTDRRRQRHDDDDPFLHQRPGADRRLPRGPAARPLGHPDMIPTKTGAAAAVGLVLPHLDGKLDGFAMRVPTINVSIVDLSFVAKRAHHRGRGGRRLKQASEGELKGILDTARAARLERLQPQPGFVDLRRHPDQGFRRHARQGLAPGTTTNGASATACSM